MDVFFLPAMLLSWIIQHLSLQCTHNLFITEYKGQHSLQWRGLQLASIWLNSKLNMRMHVHSKLL